MIPITDRLQATTKEMPCPLSSPLAATFGGFGTGLPTGGGGGGYSKKPPNPEEAPPEPVPPLKPAGGENKTEEKPKVKLKNLAWAVDKAAFNEKVGVSLEADVPTSLANIAKVEIKAIALLPNGKKEGVDTQVITLTTPGTHVETPAVAARLAAITNDDFARIVEERSPRFASLATLPLNDPAASLTELRRAVEQLKFPGAMLFSPRFGSRSIAPEGAPTGAGTVGGCPMPYTCAPFRRSAP